jgi:hypothetical protein
MDTARYGRRIHQSLNALHVVQAHPSSTHKRGSLNMRNEGLRAAESCARDPNLTLCGRDYPLQRRLRVDATFLLPGFELS